MERPVARFSPSWLILTPLILRGGLFLGGCETHSSTAARAVEPAPALARSSGLWVERCALSGRPLDSESAIRVFAGEEIRFRSESEATTFDDLPGERKRVLAGQQVLGRSGVANGTCPITQKPLPIDASVTSFENVRIGFVSQAEQRQFEGLPRDVQTRMVARHLLRSRGIPNERCPISDALLLPGCPSIEVREVRIAFADQASLDAFERMPSARRNEIVARILMPEQGISNITCPITRKPIRLDSPVVIVDGQSIALRNVQAARAFNGMPLEAQRAMVSEAN